MNRDKTADSLLLLLIVVVVCDVGALAAWFTPIGGVIAGAILCGGICLWLGVRVRRALSRRDPSME